LLFLPHVFSACVDVQGLHFAAVTSTGLAASLTWGGGGLSASLAQIARIESQDVQIYPLLPAGVRRLIVIEPETRRVEGIVSLSDIAAYLLL